MQNKYVDLIEKIQKSNLPKKDKLILINILNEESPNLNLFLQNLMTIINLSKTIIDLFGTS